MNTVPGDEELPLVEHIKELRSRMIITAVPIVIITVVAFMFSGELLQLIWKQALRLIPEEVVTVPMVMYSPMEVLMTKLTFSLACALFFGIPLIMYEAFMFIGKGLYENEKRFFIKIVPLSFILFSAGAALAYFVVVPLTFKYTVFYSIDVAAPQISVIKAIYTMITLVVGFGLIFQFPLLLIFALKMDLLKLEPLKRKRKIIYGALLAVSLFISPDPTIFSELIVAAVLVILFEFSLMVARFF
ncbi:twin arginine targeting protein translocase subunit TatC [Candidatus Methanoperedens nitroreducens]|uniref:Sec-independent protein translocase protein TatC n=1 Tax=Candidatus Methanoperedens nitratireducens TaxID=1392998 RepID=A0A062V8P4_9EURY|nr:twin-arginine translocase subunit TatC [Candidatus Methanoperedens nitroreducens]KCZ71740.1 twin arginine targeting protein translocase subunit TatC [Candidatus Methanoperedens nitroreducens]MDJ1422287.1 twin-arginine translocase subunit TatC [Candidatus Methanoperedens sp.]